MKFILALLISWMSLPTLAAKSKKPMSVSYEAVVKCFPELEDKNLSFKVDLDRLKERIDSVFATERSQLKSRVVKFRDEDGLMRRLRVADNSTQWETLSENGSVSAWSTLPIASKSNPSLAEINSVLARGRIESDIRVEHDTKLKGLVLKTRRDLAKVLELRLEDGRSKRVLNCEDRSEFGSICLCRR